MFTIRQISHTLNVTLVTVNTWLRGTSKREPLPATVKVVGSVNRIEISPSDLREWLKRYRPDLVPQLSRRSIARDSGEHHAGAD